MIKKNTPLIIYGAGKTAKSLVDFLIQKKVAIELIIDQNDSQSDYKGIPIIQLEKLNQSLAKESDCILALHNHYVNINDLQKTLIEHNFRNIISLINLEKFLGIKIPLEIYWLNYRFSYVENLDKIERIKTLFLEDKSKQIFSDIINYRSTGDINACPIPSPNDEYTPIDLPRFLDPLNIIDCGASVGAALEKFSAAGYMINEYIGFEPDLNNFSKLIQKKLWASNPLFLPLGVWNKNMQLNFSGGLNAASSINEDGSDTIQCVKLDDIIPNFSPNLIKLDVEGAELEALEGLEMIIKKNKPNLCISVYHTASHLLDIPLLIDSFDLDYKFFIRVHEQNTFGIVLYCLQKNLLREI
jgi:FkbM family methyltransferase